MCKNLAAVPTRLYNKGGGCAGGYIVARAEELTHFGYPMKKLFISYSHDDGDWTGDLWRALRDEMDYDAWIDQRIVPATDWWATVLENIETCDCFIYVMTPKAIESIYCQAEVAYALALN